LSEYFVDRAGDVGYFIERELGISCRKMGVDGYFINWENFLGNLELSDFLDVVTAVIRFSPEKRQNINGSLTVTSLLKFTRRVFSE